jgi:hypothetical protein
VQVYLVDLARAVVMEEFQQEHGWGSEEMEEFFCDTLSMTDATLHDLSEIAVGTQHA